MTTKITSDNLAPALATAITQGGGGFYDTVPATTLAPGGIGGGGAGYPSAYPGGFPAVAPFASGVANRGGGGGGAGTETDGASGGSGIVIIKYPITTL